MIGIPYRLVRRANDGSEKGDPVQKLVYLGTRRTGEAGVAFRTATRRYSKLQYQVAKVFTKYQHLERMLKELPADHAEISAKAAEVDLVLEEFNKLDDEWRDLAEQIVKKSLSAAGYEGEQLDGVIDQLTDADFHDMVQTLSTGLQPSDFSQSPVQQQQPTTTEPLKNSPSESSLNTDSPEGSSKPAK